jgi:hypothetical protein
LNDANLENAAIEKTRADLCASHGHARARLDAPHHAGSLCRLAERLWRGQ